MQGHQWGVDGGRDDRQVKVVKHDIDVLVDASVEAKVQAQQSTADALERTRVIRPDYRQNTWILLYDKLYYMKHLL